MRFRGRAKVPREAGKFNGDRHLTTPHGQASGAAGRPAARLARRLAVLLALFYVLPLGAAGCAYWFGGAPSHWSTASRASAGIAPDPAATPEAVVQVYAARAYGWRGIFGVHTWFALKPAGAWGWERLEVIGWGVERGRRAVRAGAGIPDGRWYGNPPALLAQLRGPAAAAAIPRLRAAAAAYPYPDRYTVWPGPNSNTFTAHLARQVPELRLDLPATAIGKDYPVDGIVASTPSGTGWQLSLGGLAGIAVGVEEGVEVDVLGLGVGVDVVPPALRLPGFGRLGFD